VSLRPLAQRGVRLHRRRRRGARNSQPGAVHYRAKSVETSADGAGTTPGVAVKVELSIQLLRAADQQFSQGGEWRKMLARAY
jgi:hypothetical protein